MTEEHKDELTGLCKIEIRRWKAAYEANPNMRYMVELMEVALASLTEQPVKLPKDMDASINTASHLTYADGWNDRGDCDAQAIRAAGHEVQE